MTGTNWYAESGGTHNKRDIIFKYKRILHSQKTQFQNVEIVDTEEFGRMLFLDKIAQSSEKDEFIYHEAIVHPAALTHPNPKKFCVIGGGEGATPREIFRHPGVERVVMVDIDGEVVDLCRKHLPEWNAGAFDDPRFELHIGDGQKCIEESQELFDVIIVDLSDPLPDSPAVYLFTRDFYKIIYDHLTPDGVACFQGESWIPWRLELHCRMVNTLASVFPVTAAYPYYLPAFHEPYSHILASKKEDPRQLDLGRRIMDRKLDLRYISPSFIKGLFGLPGFVQKGYADYSDILTDEAPYLVRPIAR